MRRMLSPVVIACVLLLAACGEDSASTPGNGDQDAGQADTQETATLAATDSDLGQIVVDADGNTLYMFMPDQEANGEPTCYDDCAEAWPALEATAQPSAGTGIDESLLGTVEREDGAEQVTYGDLPLYYFSGDEAAGDTNGQGLNDVWWVVGPDGQPIMDKAKSEKKKDDGDMSRDDY